MQIHACKFKKIEGLGALQPIHLKTWPLVPQRCPPINAGCCERC